MASDYRTPGGVPLTPAQASINRTVSYEHPSQAVQAANDAALSHFGARFFVEDLQVHSGAVPSQLGNYGFAWPVAPACAYLEIEWWLEPKSTSPTPPGDFGVWALLVITDALGNVVTGAVGPATPQIPPNWQGWAGGTSPGLIAAPSSGGRYDHARQGGTGALNVAELRAAGLVGSDWTVFVELTGYGVGSPIDFFASRIQGREVARLMWDNTDGAGLFGGTGPTSIYLPGAPIQVGQVTGASPGNIGCDRVLQTVQVARTLDPMLLSLAWVNDIAATWLSPATQLPQTSALAYTALTNLEEGVGSGTSITWYVPVKNVQPVTAGAGELGRFRVLYRFDATVGGHKADVQIITGRGTFTLLALPASTTWTWSPWQACAFATDGVQQEDTLQLLARVSNAARTVYLGAVCAMLDLT